MNVNYIQTLAQLDSYIKSVKNRPGMKIDDLIKPIIKNISEMQNNNKQLDSHQVAFLGAVLLKIHDLPITETKKYMKLYLRF